MPNRPPIRQIRVPGRSRRTVRATLSAGLTLPVLLLGAFASPGCRTDSGSTRLPSLNPARWLAREDALDEQVGQEVAEDADLLPVPSEGPLAPPLPPTPRRDLFAPAPAPLPEPVSHEEDDFYGVRPTAAEVEGPREPSWSARLRSLFQKQGASRNSAKPAPLRGVKVSSAEAVDRTPAQRARPTARRPAAVELGQPEFEPRVEDVASRSVQPASQVEPAPTVPLRRYEPLPRIAPGRAATRVAVDPTEPQTWPYPTADQPAFDQAPPSAAYEPEPLPAGATPVPPLMAVPEDGPALLR